ncbi:hypothetical protein ACFL1W_00415 [Candidatus Margulisiibacteriota bacterium]
MAVQFAVVGRMTSVYKKHPGLATAVYQLQKLLQEKAPNYGSRVGNTQHWVMCRFPKESKLRWIKDDVHLRLLEDNAKIIKDVNVELKAAPRAASCLIKAQDAGLQLALLENFSLHMLAGVRKYGVITKYVGGSAMAIPAGLEWVGKITDQVRCDRPMDKNGRAVFRLWNPLSRFADVDLSLIPREGHLQDQTLNEAARVVRFMAEVRLLEEKKPQDWKGQVRGKLAAWRQPVGELPSWLDVSFETKPVAFILDGNPLLIPEDPGNIFPWLRIGMVDRSGL